MTDVFQELQKAFNDMENRFGDFHVECRELAQDFREDLANHLGVPPSQMSFFKAEELCEMRANDQSGIPPQYNDPFDCGELAKGSSYQIGLCLGICFIGEDLPGWYLMSLLRFEKAGDEFTLHIGKNVHSFDLGQNPKDKLRPVSEWIVNYWKGIANQRYEDFISGRKENEMGFHMYRKNLKRPIASAGGL